MSSASHSRRLVLAAIVLPLVGARAAVLALEPRRRVADTLQPIDLEKDLPRTFGDWADDPTTQLQVVSPTVSTALADAYDQTVSRVYRSSAGAQVKLAAAYGLNQRERKLHMPAGCYGAQGWRLSKFGRRMLALDGRELPVSTFLATGPNGVSEYVAYWVVYGQMLATERLQGRYELFQQEAHGLIPDGILMRVSIDTKRGEPDEQSLAPLQNYVGAMRAAMGKTQAGRYFPPSQAEA